MLSNWDRPRKLAVCCAIEKTPKAKTTEESKFMTNLSWQVIKSEVGVRLDKWLADAARLGSRSKAFEAIARGKVFINEVEQNAMAAGRKLEMGEKVRVWVDRPGSSKQHVFTDRKVSNLHIIHEDDDLLVINKPSALLTVKLPKHPDEFSLYDHVTDYLRERSKIKLHVVHRIDRDTSGLVVFAKSFVARENLKAQFVAQKPERTYQALVYGIPTPEKGEWQDWLLWDEENLVQRQSNARDQRAVEAKCNYSVLEKFPTTSLLEIKLTTGKQNQIRVQATIHGHQLIGEKQYMAKPPQETVKFKRQALHAFRLSFRHPRTNQLMNFEAPLPDDFKTLLKKLAEKPSVRFQSK